MTANTARTRKAKGTRAEKKFAQLLRTKGIDKKARRMPMSGAIKHFKSDIFCPNLPHDSFEIKNQERVSIWQWWEQACEQCDMNETPHLVVGANHRPQLVVMHADDWANLKKIEQDYYKQEGI